MNLTIPDMSCGHCSASISRAVQALDPGARLSFDMQARRAQVQTSLPEAQVIAALEDIGFSAAAVG
jgi:copper chaperone